MSMGSEAERKTVPSSVRNHYALAVHDARRPADFYARMLGFSIIDVPPNSSPLFSMK